VPSRANLQTNRLYRYNHNLYLDDLYAKYYVVCILILAIEVIKNKN